MNDSNAPRRIRHQFPDDALDNNALNVVSELQRHDFEAFLVGGCIRDLLCDLRPKDFDVATNATPEQVKSIFRRSRLVGRRFPIAHVRFGREIIEVSTFRQGQHDDIHRDASGMIVQDRAFGHAKDDAFRRDFTINALYYDTQSREIVDYVGGFGDIEKHRIRFIGDPAERLAEDPVRLLRAIRFAAKLSFTIDADILAHTQDTADRLEAIPNARLFDEFLKLFLSGYAAPAWQHLRGTPLARTLFPSCNPQSNLVLAAMKNTDERVAAELPVTPGFIIAVLLWDDFSARMTEMNPQRKAALTFEAANDTLAAAQVYISIPRRFSHFVSEVWQMQDRLLIRNPRHALRMLQHKRFRAAYDFLALRSIEESEHSECVQWWTDLQDASAEERSAMIDALPKPKSRRRRRRRKTKPRQDD